MKLRRVFGINVLIAYDIELKDLEEGKIDSIYCTRQ